MKRASKKTVLLLTSVFALILMSVGFTAAYYVDTSETVKNKFTAADPEIFINETKTENIKSDRVITNDASENAVAVYVRARLVTYWQDEIDGELRTVPMPAGAEVSGGAVQSGWFVRDGIYYYSQKLQPGVSSSVMLSPITVTIPDGSTAQCIIDVVAEAIQAEPAQAVQNSWSVSVAADGSIS